MQTNHFPFDDHQSPVLLSREIIFVANFLRNGSCGFLSGHKNHQPLASMGKGKGGGGGGGGGGKDVSGL